MGENSNMLAVGLALVASAILSFIDNYVALVAQEAGLWQFQLTRSLMAVPLLLLIARISGQKLRPENLPRLVGRSLAVSIGLLIYFATLGTLPVAQAGAGLFSAPLWVALFTVFLFRRRLGGVGVFAVIFGFAGAVMLLQPDLDRLTTMSLLPLAAGLFYGLGMMLTGIWCADESPLALALGVFLTIGIASGIMLVATIFVSGETFLTQPWVWPTTRFLWLTSFQAIGAVVAVTLIALAYQKGVAAMVAVVEYSFLIFASFWAFLLWGTTTNLLASTGIAVIVTSGILMAVNEKRANDAATAV